MIQATNYVRGVVEIEIEGAFPERLLNICSKNGVDFWGLRRLDPQTLRAYVRVEGFRKLRPYARRSMCKIRITGRRGLRFLMWRLRKRYALLAGLVLTMALLWVGSLFVWDIQIVGAEKIPHEVIMRNLAEVGVEIGAYIPDIDGYFASNEMLMKLDELSWMAINMYGSRVVVEVRERVPRPEMIALDKPCNIVALKPGIITKINTLAGAEQVTVGESVVEGQLLVSGVMDSEVVGARFVHAMANVECRTWYNLEAVCPKTALFKEYTGESSSRYALLFNENRINVYFDAGNPYAQCDKITSTSRISLPFDVLLPFSLSSEEFFEYKTQERELDENGVRDYLRSRLEEQLRSRIGDGEVKSTSFAFEKAEVYSMTLEAECVEQIAVSEEMPESTYKNQPN